MRSETSFGRSENRRALIHQRGIHPALFYGMFAILLSGNALLGMALVFSSDIGRFYTSYQGQIIEAYENRIAQLRVEVDRLHSRSFVQAGDINMQLHELAQQQEMLLEQHQLVRVLINKANELGIEAAALPASSNILPTVPLNASGNPDLAATTASVSQMMSETQSAMAAIAQTANQRADIIAAELSKVGIPVDLPDSLSGTGGPFLPPQADEDISPLVDDANIVMTALARYKAVRNSADTAPIHMPIAGNFRLSSSFGNRTDPFSGGRAFHSGMDFAAPTGTTVLSAGKGIISFVGTRGGYGKVVEITHPNGLVTRYGHLSGYIGKQGQSVNAGSPIALVGSTGRSTGPHLHFEVRKANTAINPKPFLDVGKHLFTVTQ